jgi:GDSL/SGNH-like Acyl-Esterase family found in Pmr5 and Cas1p
MVLLTTLQGPMQYNYADFQSFDAIASDIFKNELQQPVLHLEPLYYRADAHPVRDNDCLHYCIPGPLDLAAQLLHHMLVVGEI